MFARELIFRVLLISVVRFSATSIIRPQKLLIVRLSPGPARSLENIPDRWRTVHPEFKAPQIEIQLMKGHVSPDENWMFTNEYKYSGTDYEHDVFDPEMPKLKGINDDECAALVQTLLMLRIILYGHKSISSTRKVTSTTDEKKIPQIDNGDMEARKKKKENDVQDNIVMPDRLIPQIGSRNIITVPTYCPNGQREDSRGRCRTIIT